MRLSIAVLFGLLVVAPARAERVLMEGKPSTGSSLTVSSVSVQVMIATNTLYGGAVPNVGLYTTNNVVVGTSGLVIYSTGSIVWPDQTISTTGSSGGGGGSSGTWNGGTVTNPATFTSDVYVTGPNGASMTSMTVTTPNLSVNGVQMQWPGSQGSPSTVLNNDGSGNLSWVSGSGFNGGNVANNTTFYSYVAFATNTAVGLPVGSTVQRSSSPSNGDFRINSDEGVPEYYFNGMWSDLLTVPAPIPHTTCNSTTLYASSFSYVLSGSTYCVYTFLTGDEFVPEPGVGIISLLVVGGGGGGSSGGGGGGGVLYFPMQEIATYPVGTSIIIGAGGPGAFNSSAGAGSSSTFGTGFTSTIAYGGGAGQGVDIGSVIQNGGNGASGAGGSSSDIGTSVGGLNIYGVQGNSGGGNGGFDSSDRPSGGGGGAGQLGGSATSYITPGPGGNGFISLITGTTVYYGGGGGGACTYNAGGCVNGGGGLGGGGIGNSTDSSGGVNGLDGFGGGGGGGAISWGDSGGSGGSGVIIISYKQL
jgi:hypothetical protein